MDTKIRDRLFNSTRTKYFCNCAHRKLCVFQIALHFLGNTLPTNLRRKDVRHSDGKKENDENADKHCNECEAALCLTYETLITKHECIFVLSLIPLILIDLLFRVL